MNHTVNILKLLGTALFFVGLLLAIFSWFVFYQNDLSDYLRFKLGKPLKKKESTRNTQIISQYYSEKLSDNDEVVEHEIVNSTESIPSDTEELSFLGRDDNGNVSQVIIDEDLDVTPQLDILSEEGEEETSLLPSERSEVDETSDLNQLEGDLDETVVEIISSSSSLTPKMDNGEFVPVEPVLDETVVEIISAPVEIDSEGSEDTTVLEVAEEEETEELTTLLNDESDVHVEEQTVLSDGSEETSVLTSDLSDKPTVVSEKLWSKPIKFVKKAGGNVIVSSAMNEEKR